MQPSAMPVQHPTARAGAVVAGSAEDLEALPASRQHFAGERHRHRRPECLRARGTRVGDRGRRERAPSDRSLDERPGRTLVREEIALFERPVLGLVVHLLAARSGENRHGQDERRDGPPRSHSSTATTSRAPALSKSSRTDLSSKSGSFASMQRKKRSRDAKANRGALNTGWYGLVNAFIPSMPRTAKTAAKRTVSSKVIGMNDGQLASGRPPTLIG